jgi:hypothetical protein
MAEVRGARRGGFVIKRPAGQYRRPLDTYRGLDGLTWPMQLSSGDAEAFGYGEGLGSRHRLATSVGPAADYVDICLASGEPVEVAFVESEEHGVLWADESPQFEHLGFDVVDPFDFYSAIWQELLAVCRHDPIWLARLNERSLFSTMRDAVEFLQMRGAAAAASRGTIEDVATIRVVSLWLVADLADLKRFDGPDAAYLRYARGNG